MAKEVLTDASVVVAGVNLSDHARTVTIEETKPEVDVTAMGAAYMQYTPGIRDATITVEFFQDFASGSVEQTLNGLWSAGTTFSLVIKKASGSVGATNPTFTMGSALMYSYSPISGDVGSAMTMEVAFRNAGTAGIVRATA